MDKKLKIGIVGAGGIAQERHIPAFQNLKDSVEVTALYDVNLDQAHKVGQKFSIQPTSSSYNDLLQRVDAVVICTPNKFHANLAIEALNAGVHVMCEKPMAMNKIECDQMIEASNKNEKLLTVAYHYRHTDAAIAAKKAINNGDVGNPLVTRVQALRRRKVPGWGVFTNKSLQGGGSLIDYGCHLLDLSLWLLGSQIRPVEVIGKTYNKLSKQPEQLNDWGKFDQESFDVEDHVTSFITFSNDLSLQFECSWSANVKEDCMHISLSGENGGLNLYPFEIYKPQYDTFFINSANVTHDEKIATERQALNFVNSCLGLEEIVVKAEEARDVNLLIDAIYSSNEMGHSIQL
ncbi:Gfo/Idh/MocA family protein [Staphylococcus cohnii]|uniref:Gfo/Idh/MocA family protein n=1 Tax=Staphylococcus cohnii TaxID=29382 RepID=UPI003D7D28D1